MWSFGRSPRPLTVMVAVVAVALRQRPAVSRMPIDIFPNLNLPVIYVGQPYGGMDPAQMEGLLTNYYEYHFLYISGIHHVESQNIQGMALMKLYFHPGTNMAQAMAETIGYVNRVARLHAAGHRLAVHHAVRHRQRAGRLPRPLERDRSRSARSRTRPCSRSGRCSPACPASRPRRRSAAASAPSSSASTPTGCASYRHVARRGRQGARPRATPSAPRATSAIGDEMPIVPVNSLVAGHQRAGSTSRSGPGDGPTVYPPRRRHGPGRHRHPHRLRPRQRPAAVYILGHQAGRRLDARASSTTSRRALPTMQAAPARRHQGQLRVRPVADRHRAR